MYIIWLGRAQGKRMASKISQSQQVHRLNNKQNAVLKSINRVTNRSFRAIGRNILQVGQKDYDN